MKVKNVAIVVGHNSDKQGAVRKDTGETEWMFNSRLARHIEEYARNYPDLEVQTFFRTAGPGYTREIRDVYRRVDAFGADASIELHFNSHNSRSASGTETLISGTTSSMKLGQAINTRMVATLGTRDRGLVTRRTGRGSQSLMAGRAPAVLIEPFFGSSDDDQRRTDSLAEERALAAAILDGVASALNVMPRMDLDNSRTMAATEVQKRISKAQTTTGVGSMISGGLSSIRADLESIPAVGPLAEWLPWITAGLGIVTVVFAVLLKIQANKIEAARIDDLEREIR